MSSNVHYGKFALNSSSMRNVTDKTGEHNKKTHLTSGNFFF